MSSQIHREQIQLESCSPNPSNKLGFSVVAIGLILDCKSSETEEHDSNMQKYTLPKFNMEPENGTLE